VTDSRALFKSGKRYRGFITTKEGTIPVTFNVYPLTPDEIRLKHIFPASITDKLKKGDAVYIMIENEKPLIGKFKILNKDKAFFSARLEYITEDRRKLPRIKVESLFEIKAQLLCGSERLEGKVLDLSMTSLRIQIHKDISVKKCEVVLIYGNKKIRRFGKIIRSEKGAIIVELLESDGELTDILGKIYKDLFLINQRKVYSSSQKDNS